MMEVVPTLHPAQPLVGEHLAVAHIPNQLFANAWYASQESQTNTSRLFAGM